ncbi:DinB family protein [soil metagenome]
MNDKILRQSLVALLRGGQAHVTLAGALEGLEPELRAKRPAGGGHSVWELLEHMRLVQEDILRYTLDPAWTSPPWPEGYWPEPGGAGLAEEAWRETLAGFERDLEAVIALVEDESRDLSAEIPHGEERSYLRQVFLVADHNSYHLGQIVDARRALGSWRS